MKITSFRLFLTFLAVSDAQRRHNASFPEATTCIGCGGHGPSHYKSALACKCMTCKHTLCNPGYCQTCSAGNSTAGQACKHHHKAHSGCYSSLDDYGCDCSSGHAIGPSPPPPTPSPSPPSPPPSPPSPPSPPAPCPPAPPGANQVWLSIGYGNASHESMESKWDVCESYKKGGAITGTSLVMYHISEDGSIINEETGDPSWTAKQFQQDLKKKLGLKAVPLLMCITNYGDCPKSGREAVLQNPQKFIDALMSEVSTYGWDGLAMDFENIDNWDGFSDVFDQLGAALLSAGKEFHVWYGTAGAEYGAGLKNVTSMWSMVTEGEDLADIEHGNWGYKHGDFPLGVGLTRADQPEGRAGMKALSTWALQRGKRCERNVRHFNVWDGADQFHNDWVDGFSAFINNGLSNASLALFV